MLFNLRQSNSDSMAYLLFILHWHDIYSFEHFSTFIYLASQFWKKVEVYVYSDGLDCDSFIPNWVLCQS